jgi:uncharacterized membrane protein
MSIVIFGAIVVAVLSSILAMLLIGALVVLHWARLFHPQPKLGDAAPAESLRLREAHG